MSLKAHDILLKMISSSVKCEVLTLFRKDPDLKESIEGLASRIGRSADMIEPDVNDLVEIGLLKRERVNMIELISWSRERDEEIQSEIIKALPSGQETRDRPQTRTTSREGVSLAKIHLCNLAGG